MLPVLRITPIEGHETLQISILIKEGWSDAHRVSRNPQVPQMSVFDPFEKGPVLEEERSL